MSPKRQALIVFLVIFGVAMAWALYTDHAWEDYYITYRASKNLATGHGLTFTEGERVHSFTSPLGVLLPALASVMTGNSSDYAALWIFRLMSGGALAGAGLILLQFARARFSSGYSTLLLLAFFATDAKIIDYSTNGMETAFVLLFLAWSLNALVMAPARQVRHLGLAWAGLMWTRPDSFIYIGAMAFGAFLSQPGEPRIALLKRFFAAGAVTAVLYLPWLLWAWAYYGSPVPNTIVAKGLFSAPVDASTCWHWLRDFPRAIFVHRDVPTTTFMPGYSFNTGWPEPALKISFWMSCLTLLIWILPGVRREARIASFTFCVGQFYLINLIGFPTPWYLPTVTLFAFVALAGAVDPALAWSGRTGAAPGVRRTLRPVLLAGAGLLLAGAVAISLASARQLRWQQDLIENQQRRAIGLWLRANSPSPRMTVFLEPLGYIGFFSGLKMFDYPGLSSPEVIAARRRATGHNYPDCWPELILDLQPDWLVFRNYETDAVRRADPRLLPDYYKLAKVFDLRSAVQDIPHIAGRGYLLNDAYFEVYRFKFERSGDNLSFWRIRAADLLVNECWGRPAYDSEGNLVAHAPSRLVVKLPGRAGAIFSGSFGLFEGAYDRKDGRGITDGAEFSVTVQLPDGSRQELLRRFLNPRDEPSDRGGQAFRVEIPRAVSGQIELEVDPGPDGNNALDWSYWSGLVFEVAR